MEVYSNIIRSLHVMCLVLDSWESEFSSAILDHAPRTVKEQSIVDFVTNSTIRYFFTVVPYQTNLWVEHAPTYATWSTASDEMAKT